ncbi:MAG: hypothetical protein RIR18_40 [Pseudomonadota bacterium]|jgi:hypothetical protein
MSKKQKLELTWIGKENHPKLEPRILLEAPEKFYYAKQRVHPLRRWAGTFDSAEWMLFTIEWELT